MFYYLIAALIVVGGLCLLYVAARLLGEKSWLVGFIKGLSGLMVAGIGVLLILLAVDLLGYKQVMSEKPIATLSFERLGEQSFRAVLLENDGRESRFDIAGDQWQLDARIVRWPMMLASLGAKPAYRLDRLGGRYYSLEKERQNNRTIYNLAKDNGWVDLWPLMLSANDWLPMQAQYGSATFLPMADGAIYSIALTSSGLVGKPINDPAKQAVQRWQ
ncbi:hypothetical protein L1F30_09300 [Simiduia sp. 21SJ11W-1]|uniref:hypothetical protein n=1 Tax=Simiduia sp. 21SJ11W-1 TaxID=2909669 RepID=UPI00209F095F|nr:hypothetical protein [Simiduia sp. 21SJ11W-1]UTA46371.1 hypothetical protein L1F30_09300 [Simiduia sp. 21SJ11W-1]